ncbi:hypothetical protein BDY19DRAFT_996412 [Irpex rosettiformis]|uniref:Uncharacterized protein n=1 Tax=Irpex rosettiformis TaxID=378272 RepID=A0ACB8TUY5_9APHY|nr:hypothetical protein BDY19DRAFT_996412 [Irpex rosettiformis]
MGKHKTSALENLSSKKKGKEMAAVGSLNMTGLFYSGLSLLLAHIFLGFVTICNTLEDERLKQLLFDYAEEITDIFMQKIDDMAIATPLGSNNDTRLNPGDNSSFFDSTDLVNNMSGSHLGTHHTTMANSAPEHVLTSNFGSTNFMQAIPTAVQFGGCIGSAVAGPSSSGTGRL